MKYNLKAIIAGASVILLISALLSFIGAILHVDLSTPSMMMGISTGIPVFMYFQMKSGNRRIVFADQAAKDQAMQFTCPPGRSLLYVVRTGFIGSAVGLNIDVDGRTLTQLKSPMFTCIELAPGSHALDAHMTVGIIKNGGFAPAHQDFVLEPGSVTCLHLDKSTKLTRAQLRFEAWSIDQTRTRVRSMRMALPTTSEQMSGASLSPAARA